MTTMPANTPSQIAIIVNVCMIMLGQLTNSMARYTQENVFFVYMHNP